MPLSGIGSYLPTMDEFIAHWTAVNEAIAPAEIKLSGAYDVGNLEQSRAQLADAVAATIQADSDLTQRQTMRDSLKEVPRERLLQLRKAIPAWLPGSRYTRNVPTMPRDSLPQSAYLEPFQRAAVMWTTINGDTGIAGFTPPLKLAGGYTLAQFQSAIDALNSIFTQVTRDEETASQARSNRDVLLDPIRERLIQYRAAVVATLPAGSPLIATLPAVTPNRGHTPDSVTLSATFNSTSGKTNLSWTPSTDPDLLRYSARMTPSPRYKSDDEIIIGDIAPGTTEFEAAQPSTGATVCFKIYVVLSTGNEKGSNSVKIVHP